MKYYPVNLDVSGKNCLVVGGGSVGARKTRTLARCGARVTVISTEFSPDFNGITSIGEVNLVARPYSPDDLSGRFLVMGATDNPNLNSSIAKDANDKNILCNIVDAPELSSFIVPAVVNRGDLSLAISTSGTSPAFARQLRKDLEDQFGEEYAVFLKLMGRLRNRLLSTGHAPDDHRRCFRELISRGLLDLIRDQDTDAVDTLLMDVFGPGYSLKEIESGEHR